MPNQEGQHQPSLQTARQVFLTKAFVGGVGVPTSSIIFGPWQQVVIIGLYGLILILGLVFNVAIVWVIVGESILISSPFLRTHSVDVELLRGPAGTG